MLCRDSQSIFDGDMIKMEKIRLITDSVSDISYDDEKQYDIRVLPFEVVLGDKS